MSKKNSDNNSSLKDSVPVVSVTGDNTSNTIKTKSTGKKRNFPFSRKRVLKSVPPNRGRNSTSKGNLVNSGSYVPDLLNPSISVGFPNIYKQAPSSNKVLNVIVRNQKFLIYSPDHRGILAVIDRLYNQCKSSAIFNPPQFMHLNIWRHMCMSALYVEWCCMYGELMVANNVTSWPAFMRISPRKLCMLYKNLLIPEVVMQLILEFLRPAQYGDRVWYPVPSPEFDHKFFNFSEKVKSGTDVKTIVTYKPNLSVNEFNKTPNEWFNYAKSAPSSNFEISSYYPTWSKRIHVYPNLINHFTSWQKVIGIDINGLTVLLSKPSIGLPYPAYLSIVDDKTTVDQTTSITCHYHGTIEESIVVSIMMLHPLIFQSDYGQWTDYGLSNVPTTALSWIFNTPSVPNAILAQAAPLVCLAFSKKVGTSYS